MQKWGRVYVRGADFRSAALGFGQVNETGVDQGFDLPGRLSTERVSNCLKRYEWRMSLFEHHERWGTHLFRFLLVQNHWQQDQVNLQPNNKTHFTRY